MAQIAHLLAFLEAADQGSFIAASDRLHLSHSSVSARIRTLEDELGVRLFHRGRHGVELNEVGASLLPFAENIVQSWIQAGRSTRAVASGNIPIRAGIQQDLWEVFGAEWFTRLREQIPELQLHLTSDYSTQLCERVERGLLDIALTFEPQRERGVSLELLTELPLVLACSHSFAWHGSLPPDYLYVDWGQRFEDWHDGCFGPRLDTPLIVGVSSIALGIMQKRGGAAYQLRQALTACSDLIGEVEGAPEFAVKVFLVGRSEPEATPTLKLVRESIREEIGNI